MKHLLKRMEDRLFSATDTVCLDRARLVTEAYARYADEPVPILRARVFEHVLRNMRLDLLSNPVFAGNTSSVPRAWMLIPEFGFDEDAQVALEHSELKGFLDGKIPPDIRVFWRDRQFGGHGGIGHMSLDLDLVVNRGLDSIVASLEKRRDDLPPENRVFREAMAVSCRAVIEWAHRYAQAAEEAASQTDDPDVAVCLRRMAAACRHVPAQPARNLFEGLQAMALVHMAGVIEGQGMSMSIGLPDRALARFRSEVEDNPEQSVNLIRAFLLRIASNSFLGRGSKTQAITIGGAAPEGDACSAVTLAFLDAFDKTPVSDPHLFLRCHEGLEPAVWERGLSMLSAGRSMPLLVNDHQVVPGLLAAGVTAPDAWDYCIVGCNELGIPGRCCQSANSIGMGFNDLNVIDALVRGLPDEACNTEYVLDAYERRVHDLAEAGLTARRARLAQYAAERPFPFCSALCPACAESGQDLLRGMRYPDLYGFYIRGTANAVNVLVVIEHLVTRGHHRVGDLLAGVQARDPKILETIAEAPKWGDDNDEADRLAVALNVCRDRALREVAGKAGLPPFAVCHVVRSLHHLDGRRLGPTLDGREGGAPVGDSIGPVMGTQSNGPTAMLNSVLKLDAAQWFTGIYNLNLTLPAGAQAHPTVIRGLAEAFFHGGGQELQVNVLDANTLRKARVHPERYQGLVVRVAGLNARFVELSAEEQDELIRRAEMASGLTGRVA